jgi:hypothetical protein
MAKMNKSSDPLHTGGCQCGAVRYALYSEPFNPHICHCRMCQKAAGSFFAPFASVNLENFAWTRGTPGIFKSSPVIERAFCRQCGTPLAYRNIENPHISLTIGSLDEPERVQPAVQTGIESRMSWFSDLSELPEMETDIPQSPVERRKFESRQHPDIDTGHWP